jgi:hypothetical protein
MERIINCLKQILIKILQRLIFIKLETINLIMLSRMQFRIAHN